MIRQADYYMYQVKNGKLGTDIKKDIMTKTGRMLWIEYRKADVSM